MLQAAQTVLGSGRVPGHSAGAHALVAPPDMGVGTAAQLPDSFRGRFHRVGFADMDRAQLESVDRLSQFPASWAPRPPGAGELAQMAAERTLVLEQTRRERGMFVECPHAWCHGRYPAAQIVEMAASCKCLHQFSEAEAAAAEVFAVAGAEGKAVSHYAGLREEAEQLVAGEEKGAAEQRAARDAAQAEAERHAADEAAWTENHRAIKKERKDLEAGLIETAEELNAAQKALAEHKVALEKALFFVDGYQGEIEGAEEDMVEFKFRALELANATEKRNAANGKLRVAMEKHAEAKSHADKQQARVSAFNQKMEDDQQALDDALAKNPKRAHKALVKAQERARKAEGERIAHNLAATEHGRGVSRNAKVEDVHQGRQQTALDEAKRLRAAMVGYRAGVREPHLRRLEGYVTVKRRAEPPPMIPDRTMLPPPGAEDLALRKVNGGGEHDPTFRDYLSGARRKAKDEHGSRHEQCPYCMKLIRRAPNRDAAGHVVDVAFLTVVIDPKVHPHAEKMLNDRKLMKVLEAEKRQQGGEEAKAAAAEAKAAAAEAKAASEAKAAASSRPPMTVNGRPGTSGSQLSTSSSRPPTSGKVAAPKKPLLKIKVSPEMLQHWTEVEGVDSAQDFSESEEEVEVEDEDGEMGTVVRAVRRYHGASCPVVVMCRHHSCAQLLARDEAVEEAREHTGAEGVEPLDVEQHCEKLRLTKTWRHERYGRKPEKLKVKPDTWQCKNCLVRNLFWWGADTHLTKAEKEAVGPDGAPVVENCTSCGKPRLSAKEAAQSNDAEMQRLREIAEKAQKELHETPQARAAREARERHNKRDAAKQRKKARHTHKVKHNRRGSQEGAKEHVPLLDARTAHEEGSCAVVHWHAATHTKDRQELRRWINAQHERHALRRRVERLAALVRAGDNVFVHSTRAGEKGTIRDTVLLNFELASVAPGQQRRGQKLPWRWAQRGEVLGPHPATKQRLHVGEEKLHRVLDVYFYERTKDDGVYTLKGEGAPGKRRVCHTVLLADVLPPIAFPLAASEGVVTAKGIVPYDFTPRLRRTVLEVIEEDKRYAIRVPDDELLTHMPKLDMSIHERRETDDPGASPPRAALEYEFEGGAGRGAKADEVAAAESEPTEGGGSGGQKTRQELKEEAAPEMMAAGNEAAVSTAGE